MVAVGLFLATLLWLGWDGGAVGAEIATGLHGAFGAAAYVIPLVLIGVGGLMLVRSKIVDLKPFRTGLVVGAFGLMIALGRDEGGAIGGALGGGLAHVIGETGALIVGVALFIAGTLLFTGASAGAVLRGSGQRGAARGRRRPAVVRRPRPRRAWRVRRPGRRARRCDGRHSSTLPRAIPTSSRPIAASAESPPLVLPDDDDAVDAITGGDERGPRLRGRLGRSTACPTARC